MKKFKVGLALGHESYNGYDHKDGVHEYTVEARNSESAIKKAKKLKPWGYWINQIMVTEVKNES